MQHKGAVLELIRDALLDAYPQRHDLAQMVQFKMNENLNAIAGYPDLPRTVFEFVMWAEQRNRIDDLLQAALSARSTNKDLEQAEQVWKQWLKREESGEEMVGGVVAPPPSHFARKECSPYQSPSAVHRWSTDLARVSNRMCRIECGDRGLGTGFLIGPRLVVTADHVVDLENLDGTMLRFNYDFEPDGLTLPEGQVYELARPYVVDKGPHYVVLLVDGAPGNDTTPDGGERGWLRLSGRQVEHHEPLFMMFYHSGGPLKIGRFESITPVVEAGPRSQGIIYTTRHDVNSVGGSGAPVLDVNWEVVGLHLAFLSRRHLQQNRGESVLERLMFDFGEDEQIMASLEEAGGVSLRVGLSAAFLLEQPSLEIALALSNY